MTNIDSLKIVLLLAAIGIWFLGFRANDSRLMTLGLSLVVVAFALRFFKTRPPGAPSS